MIRLFRADMRAAFEADPDMEVVGMAATSDRVIALSEHRQLDLVLMDLQMRGVDGIEAR